MANGLLYYWSSEEQLQKRENMTARMITLSKKSHHSNHKGFSAWVIPLQMYYIAYKILCTVHKSKNDFAQLAMFQICRPHIALLVS